MNEFRFICTRLILYERVLKILSVTERHRIHLQAGFSKIPDLRLIIIITRGESAYFVRDMVGWNVSLSERTEGNHIVMEA